MDKAALAAGVRLIALTRPGYGDTDPLPGRRVAVAADDVREVLDHLGIGTFVTLGWSGGGPHALACAARLPGRCLAAATLGSIAPCGAAGLDFLAGMGEENVVEFSAAMSGEAALSAWMAGDGAAYRTITAETLFAAFGSLLPPVDTKVLTGELVESLAETIRHALMHGVRGWLDDDLVFVNPWGFDVREIRVPTIVWQGHAFASLPVLRPTFSISS